MITSNIYDPIDTIVLKNSFAGGKIKVRGKDTALVPDGGLVNYWRESYNNWYWAEAIDRQHVVEGTGLYARIYRDWIDKNMYQKAIAPQLRFDIPLVGGNIFTARFSKEDSVEFDCSYSGAVLKVDNGSGLGAYSCPTSPFLVQEPNSIYALAVDTLLNGMHYTFQAWFPGEIAERGHWFTPTAHTTYTANFSMKPAPVNVTFCGGSVGEFVRVEWLEHVNGSVTYRIYRSVAKGELCLISTLPHGTITWTDPGYAVTDENITLLRYQVRAHYGPTQTESDPGSCHSLYGNLYKKPEGGAGELISPRITNKNFSLSVYPNPFNPNTTINYYLPAEGHVKLKLYDMMGKEVASLVDALLQPGQHIVRLDGANLASGSYFCRVTVMPRSGLHYRETRKMILLR